jgi:hypothetical protein
MATLELDPVSGRYRIRFRYANCPYKRSLKTSERREAEGILGRVEETLRLLERGRMEIPPEADPGTFILSDGKLNGKAIAPVVMILSDRFDLYDEKLPAGAKEASTLQGEKLHRKHLPKHLRSTTIIQSLTPGDLQSYVEKRLREKWHGRQLRRQREPCGLRQAARHIRFACHRGRACVGGIVRPRALGPRPIGNGCPRFAHLRLAKTPEEAAALGTSPLVGSAGRSLSIPPHLYAGLADRRAPAGISWAGPGTPSLKKVGHVPALPSAMLHVMLSEPGIPCFRRHFRPLVCTAHRR